MKIKKREEVEVMGTFAGYTGGMDILEEERDDFTQKILKLLNYSGMMNFEVVNMFGMELGLIKEVELDEKGMAYFHYNYFEDDVWEDAGYNSKTGKFFTNKVGIKEFCNAVLAAYTLYECYDQTLGVTWLDADAVGCTGYTAWINHLFGSQHTMERRVKYFFNLMAQAVIENSSYHETMFEEGLHDICPRVKESALDKCDIIDLTLIQMGAGEIDIFAKNLREIGEIGMYEYVKDICACKESILRYFDNEEPETTEERIWDLLELEIKVRKAYENTPLDPVAEIAEYTLFLPARVIVYLTAECVDQDFWEVWEDIGEFVYSDEVRKQYESEAEKAYRKSVMDTPIEPISTATFLSAYGTFYETDADRLYWWDGTEEVTISGDLELWLQELKKKYFEILDTVSHLPKRTDQFLKEFMNLLKDIDNKYHRIFAFVEMCYEFNNHSNQPEYQAAIELLRVLADENEEIGRMPENAERYWSTLGDECIHNIGRLRIKRYLSLLANKKLRQKYLEF